MFFNSSKPIFFQNKEVKFHEIDPNANFFIGEEASLPLSTKQMYCKGNYEDLENTLKITLCKEKVKILYIGDNLFTDCNASEQLENWNSIAICEELLSN